MSQSGVLNIAGSTPSIPTSFLTADGTATPAANILTIVGATSTDNVANGIVTSGSGSTVTVSITNRLRGTATVTGATTGDIITFALGAAAAVYRFQFEVVGRDTTVLGFLGKGIGYTVFSTVRTDGAAATLIQTPFIDSDEDTDLSSALIDVVVSGNSVILRATGVAGQDISYVAVGEYVAV